MFNAFGPGAPSFNPGAFGGGMDLDAGGYKLGNTSGKSSMFDPLSLGLGAANIGLSIWGGMRQQRQADRSYDLSKQMATAKMAAARDRLANEVQMARDAAKFSEGSKIGDRVAQFGYGADLNFGRELEAQRLRRTELADLDFANNLRKATADRDFKLSGASQRVMDLDSRRRMKESLAATLASGRGMFGPIAPIDLNQMVI